MKRQRFRRWSPPLQPKDPERAFSLIELAVVLFTLTLLCCVVFPARAKSGDNGRRTVCFNNLRQLGVAAAMHGNDNRDYLAPPNWDGGSGSAPPGWLYMGTNGSLPDPGPGGAYATNPAAAYVGGLWFPYVRDPRVYLCPVDIESKTYTATNQPRRLERLSSYVMNGAVNGYTIGTRSCKITDAWSPSCYLLWGPDENGAGLGNPGTFAFNDGSVYPSVNEGLIERLHSLTGGEILTVGGSVQFVSVQRFRAEATSPGRSLAWWNPFSVNGH